PTMLGVVSEQMPRGGALTLNAISGIGMLAVGTLGFPYIGTLQADKAINAVAKSELTKEVPGLVKDGKLTVIEEKRIYEIIPYEVIDDAKLGKLVQALPKDKEEAVTKEATDIRNRSKQGALANMAVFPIIMLVGYILLIGYFKARGGYKAEIL